LEVAAVRDRGLWKKWIVGTEAIFLSEVSDPVDSDVMEIVADREENRREGFRVLRPDLAWVWWIVSRSTSIRLRRKETIARTRA
jgi:hypothetical protein